MTGYMRRVPRWPSREEDHAADQRPQRGTPMPRPTLRGTLTDPEFWSGVGWLCLLVLVGVAVYLSIAPVPHGGVAP